MRKKLTVWIIGGVVTLSAFGLGTMATGKAAEKDATNQPSMQGMEMMKDTDMQKKCMEMMKNTDMQKQCMDMMK